MNDFVYHPLLNLPLIVGAIFFLAGLVLLKFPPKEINFLYGYRTAQSMANQEKWDFAQKYAAKQMMIGGLFLLLLALFLIMIDFRSYVNFVSGLGLVFLVMLLFYFRVEKAIKRKFGKF